jgi:hypothetical protein
LPRTSVRPFPLFKIGGGPLGFLVGGIFFPSDLASREEDEIPAVFNESPTVPPEGALNVDVSSAGTAGNPNGDDDDKFDVPSEQNVINSALRPSKPGSTTTRGIQALQKKLDNPAKSANFTGLNINQATVNSIIREVLSSPNPIVRSGSFRSQKAVIDIINPSTGRGIRLLRDSGEFDTFINL